MTDQLVSLQVVDDTESLQDSLTKQQDTLKDTFEKLKEFLLNLSSDLTLATQLNDHIDEFSSSVERASDSSPKKKFILDLLDELYDSMELYLKVIKESTEPDNTLQSLRLKDLGEIVMDLEDACGLEPPDSRSFSISDEETDDDFPITDSEDGKKEIPLEGQVTPMDIFKQLVLLREISAECESSGKFGNFKNNVGVQFKELVSAIADFLREQIPEKVRSKEEQEEMFSLVEDFNGAANSFIEVIEDLSKEPSEKEVLEKLEDASIELSEKISEISLFAESCLKTIKNTTETKKLQTSEKKIKRTTTKTPHKKISTSSPAHSTHFSHDQIDEFKLNISDAEGGVSQDKEQNLMMRRREIYLKKMAEGPKVFSPAAEGQKVSMVSLFNTMREMNKPTTIRESSLAPTSVSNGRDDFTKFRADIRRVHTSHKVDESSSTNRTESDSITSGSSRSLTAPKIDIDILKSFSSGKKSHQSIRNP